MTYKEALFFIARCLTISYEKENLDWIKQNIKEDKVDWDNIVKVSTGHFVFPALYHNLKKENLLSLLPNELVAYMEHISSLNRDRNMQIIGQVKEINLLLKQHNINPIFVKGSALILQGIYNDISERMVGDIDFIVAEKKYEKTAELLVSNNYQNVSKESYHFPQFKHLPRLHHSSKIAAVEIHKELLIEGYETEFNFDTVSQNTISSDGITFMSYANQLCLAILAKQVNDDGQYFNNMSLRNGYDVFLLSQKTDSLKAIEHFDKLFNPINNFLAVCNQTFNSNSLLFQEKDETKKYLEIYNRILHDDKFRAKYFKTWKRKIAIKKRVKFIRQSFSRKENRIWMYRRFMDKNWRREKLIQLRIIKPKK